LLVDKTNKSIIKTIKSQQKKEDKWTSFANGEMAAVALGHT